VSARFCCFRMYAFLVVYPSIVSASYRVLPWILISFFNGVSSSPDQNGVCPRHQYPSLLAQSCENFTRWPPNPHPHHPHIPSRIRMFQDEPQLFIVPTVDAVNFQKGYLGAEGERAAIEGELQIKGLDPRLWSKV
jgi:hypothetical protein